MLALFGDSSKCRWQEAIETRITQSNNSSVDNSGKKPQAAGTNKTTKAATVLKLLEGKQGATISAVSKATGWQSLSVWGFLSRTFNKRMGLNLVSAAGKDGVRRYRVGQTANKAAEQTIA